MDGWITIGTELSTDKFDRKIIELEKKMQKEEDKKITLGIDIELQEKDLEIARQKTDELAQAYLRLKNAQDAISQGIAGPKDYSMVQDIQNTYGSMQQLELSFLKAFNLESDLEQKAINMRLRYQEINEKVAEYKAKIESVKLDKQVADVQKIKAGFSNVNGAILGTTKSIWRMVLGIFSISSAFYAIRQAMSTLTQYNETLANQIQAIKLSLAVAIEPIVNFIVNVVGKVVSLLGYILKQLFGIDIFARATALSFNKINKAAGGTNKTVKELKKQLAGFDEINVLNKDGTTGVGGALSSGIGDAISDVGTLQDALNDLNSQGESIFNNFRNWLWPEGKSIFDVGSDVFDALISNFQIAFLPIVSWFDTNVWKPVKDVFIQTWDDVSPYLDPIKVAFQKIIDDDIKPLWKDLLDNYLKPLWDGFYTNVISPVADIFEPIGLDIYNALVPYINDIIDIINSMFGGFGLHIDKIETKTKKSEGNIGKTATKAIDEIGNKAEKSGTKVEKKLNSPLKNIKDAVKDLNKKTINITAKTKNLDTLKTRIKSLWEDIKKIIGKSLDINIYASAGGGKGSSGYGGGGGFRAKGGIFYPSLLPKLALGGIINQPR